MEVVNGQSTQDFWELLVMERDELFVWFGIYVYPFGHRHFCLE